MSSLKERYLAPLFTLRFDKINTLSKGVAQGAQTVAAGVLFLQNKLFRLVTSGDQPSEYLLA